MTSIVPARKLTTLPSRRRSTRCGCGPPSAPSPPSAASPSTASAGQTTNPSTASPPSDCSSSSTTPCPSLNGTTPKSKLRLSPPPLRKVEPWLVVAHGRVLRGTLEQSSRFRSPGVRRAPRSNRSLRRPWRCIRRGTGEKRTAPLSLSPLSSSPSICPPHFLSFISARLPSLNYPLSPRLSSIALRSQRLNC